MKTAVIVLRVPVRDGYPAAATQLEGAVADAVRYLDCVDADHRTYVQVKIQDRPVQVPA